MKLLGSAAGGGHHVITKRRLLLDYAIKGMNPFVPVITTTTQRLLLPQEQSTEYPTAMLDFDGNERASLQFRDSDLNLLHILLQQLQRSDYLSRRSERRLTDQFFSTLDAQTTEWQQNLDQINEELGALRRAIERQRALVRSATEKVYEGRYGGRTRRRSETSLRLAGYLDWAGPKLFGVRAHSENLLACEKKTFNPAKLKIDDLIPRRVDGRTQHYPPTSELRRRDRSRRLGV